VKNMRSISEACKAYEFLCQRPHTRCFARGPSGLDPQVASLNPTQILKPALESRYTGLSLRIAFSEVHEDRDPPHPLALLRARRERPRSRAAEQRDELASSLVEHGLPLGTRCASLPQAQDAPEAPAGPGET